MKVMLLRLLVALALLGGFVGTSVVRAEECSREEMARAKPHFNNGAKAFRIGELQKAADQFKAAYEACASPLFLYNLGQTYRQLKDPEKALYFYKQFLSTIPAADERRADVEKWVEQLQSQIASRAAPQAPETRPASPVGAPAPAAVSATVPSHPTSTDTGIRETRVPRRKPVFKQWWLWTTVAIVAGGIGVGVGLGLEHSRSSNYTAPGITF
jgi:hypothetical protein